MCPRGSSNASRRKRSHDTAYGAEIVVREADAMTLEALSPVAVDRPPLGEFSSLGRRRVPVQQMAEAAITVLPAAVPALLVQCARPRSR